MTRNIFEHSVKEAWSPGDADVVKRSLERLALSLEADHPGAAASVREGLAETLTLQKLGTGGTLYKKLRSTNVIENLNKRDRDVLEEREALAGKVDGRSLGQRRDRRTGEEVQSGSGMARH
jgi:phytoene dehydrogenase-like protein